MTQLKVLVYPKASNPYQDLLYGELQKNNDMQIKLLNGPESVLTNALQIFIITAKLFKFRAKGYRIFHLHWLYPLDFPGRNRIPCISQFISTVQVYFFLRLIRLLRYKLVWTVHDLIPHDKHTIDDVRVSRKLAKQAKAKIVLSASMVGDMKKLNIDTNNVSIIPIGTYEDIYLDSVSAVEARQKLNIDHDSFVFCSFGRVEPYKGLENLIDAFTSLAISMPDKKLTLLIAGMSNNVFLSRKLESMARKFSKLKPKNSDIKLNLRFIKDGDVQLYHKSADIEVYPFTKISNSSSVLLSFAFTKPVIAPRMGSLRDLPKDTGIFYDHNSLSGLEQSMREVLLLSQNARNRMSQEASKYSASLSWNKISANTYNIYKGLGNS